VAATRVAARTVGHQSGRRHDEVARDRVDVHGFACFKGAAVEFHDHLTVGVVGGESIGSWFGERSVGELAGPAGACRTG